MPQMKFSVDGHVQLSRNMRVFAEDMKQMHEFFRDAIDIIEARTDQIFAAQGNNIEKAGSWAPLSPKTLKARERGWGYYKQTPNRPSMMRWTGRMQDTKNKNINDQFGELSFTARSKKGFNYPAAHQAGSGNLPQRVIIDLSNPTNELIVKALQEKIQRDMGIFGRQV